MEALVNSDGGLSLIYRLLQILEGYADIYKRRFMEIFRQKLGLVGEEEEDEYIVGFLLKVRSFHACPVFHSPFNSVGSRNPSVIEYHA